MTACFHHGFSADGFCAVAVVLLDWLPAGALEAWTLALDARNKATAALARSTREKFVNNMMDLPLENFRHLRAVPWI
jgi:hypothetical protein